MLLSKNTYPIQFCLRKSNKFLNVTLLKFKHNLFSLPHSGTSQTRRPNQCFLSWIDLAIYSNDLTFFLIIFIFLSCVWRRSVLDEIWLERKEKLEVKRPEILPPYFQNESTQLCNRAWSGRGKTRSKCWWDTESIGDFVDSM